MKTIEIKAGLTYRGRDNVARKVVKVIGRGRNRQVKFECPFPVQGPGYPWMKIRRFADLAVSQV